MKASRAVTLLIALVLAACASGPPPGPPKDYVEVEVFYATDRARTGFSVPALFYGGGRGELEYGVSAVSIPRTHQKGELESPAWWKFEFTEDSNRHIVLRQIAPLNEYDFRSVVSARAEASAGKDVLVFVHGFNTSFEDALRRTAQIAYDLKFAGVPITYSWPSQGSAAPLGYTTDETNVEWTEPHLRQFLVDLKASLGADVRIHLIAHSMGNRALTKVLRSLAAASDTALFNQVILAAPDIDREVFERDIAPEMLRAARRTTMYASSDDRALQLSAKVHNYARAGQSNPPLVYVPGLDVVDASGMDTSALGHTYFADQPLLLNDLVLLLKDEMAPPARKLLALPPNAPRYWGFPR
jgi:esterase/lipase superfamily enzyme